MFDESGALELYEERSVLTTHPTRIGGQLLPNRKYSAHGSRRVVIGQARSIQVEPHPANNHSAWAYGLQLNRQSEALLGNQAFRRKGQDSPGLFLRFSSRRAQVVAWWCFAAAGSTVDLEQVNEEPVVAKCRQRATWARLLENLMNNPG